MPTYLPAQINGRRGNRQTQTKTTDPAIEGNYENDELLLAVSERANNEHQRLKGCSVNIIKGKNRYGIGRNNKDWRPTLSTDGAAVDGVIADDYLLRKPNKGLESSGYMAGGCYCFNGKRTTHINQISYWLERVTRN